MMHELKRRQFLDSAAAVAVAGTLAGQSTGGVLRRETNKPQTPRWYEHAYRRAVIDMHIPDWDENFLSEFDPDQYVSMLVRSRAQSVVCYCQSHVGLFNYPTQVGKQHGAWKGRNVLHELIDRAHQNGIAVQLYTSLIFDRWAGDTHPEWRMRTWDGKIQGEGGRHAVLCINSPYRQYVQRFVEEICETFDFEGIRFDMTFWPWLCYCQYCQQRFAQEIGGEMPQTIHWLDERWVAFQRARERWLVEFAEMATSTVRKRKPHASVEHQSSTYPSSWMLAVTAPLARQNDFLQGDFYGDQLQGSFVRKLLEDLTPNRPFGYETSFSVALKDHTAMKPEPLLAAKASAAIADSAAFIFIDAIDPIGTVNPRAHEPMGRIFDQLMPYYQHLGGQRVQDVAIYYSLESKFHMAGSGRHVSGPDTVDSHTESSMQAAARLLRHHLPLGVIAKASLSKLPDSKVLILSNVNMMDEEECQAIRKWVREGGKLLATGGSSLVDKQGRKHSDFMLADLLGVSLVKANWSSRIHYITPTLSGQHLFADFDAKYPALSSGYAMEVKPHPGTNVLATTTLPWPAPNATKFSSIHSDPPWHATSTPEITLHAYGQGFVIYCSSLIENIATLADSFVALVRLLENGWHFEATAPVCVEVTMFHEPERQRYVLSLINFQEELLQQGRPNIPVEGIEIRLRLPERVKQVAQLPEERPIPLERRDKQLTVLRVPRLETLAMFAVRVG
jgi:hypothetical protein